MLIAAAEEEVEPKDEEVRAGVIRIRIRTTRHDKIFFGFDAPLCKTKVSNQEEIQSITFGIFINLRF